ncbi:helix-turn-helix domain-containing protein [Acidovorax sp. LjRoot118]
MNQASDKLTDVNELSDRLKSAREALNLSQTELATRAKVSAGTIGNIEAGTRKNPRDLLSIASALCVRPEWLLHGLEPRSYKDDQTENAGRPRVTRPTPVVGTAKMGDDGYYMELQHPVGHGDGFIDGYSSDPEAYALRVKGDSMHPAIRHGSFVVVEPNGNCMPGEYVAIGLVGGQRMVKELIMERQDEVVIESVNGNHRRTLERAEIEWIHPVAAVVAASKWRAE